MLGPSPHALTVGPNRRAESSFSSRAKQKARNKGWSKAGLSNTRSKGGGTTSLARKLLEPGNRPLTFQLKGCSRWVDRFATKGARRCHCTNSLGSLVSPHQNEHRHLHRGHSMASKCCSTCAATFRRSNGCGLLTERHGCACYRVHADFWKGFIGKPKRKP